MTPRTTQSKAPADIIGEPLCVGCGRRLPVAHHPRLWCRLCYRPRKGRAGRRTTRAAISRYFARAEA